jgi:hypothetical protein
MSLILFLVQYWLRYYIAIPADTALAKILLPSLKTIWVEGFGKM